jgi:hypothetical protein
MNLLNSYLEEIRHRLPPKNRADIIAEIRSVLLDMIEERNPAPGTDPSEATIKAVLQAYGSPKKVAQQYSSHQHLIGPQSYPVYVQVLKIVLIVVAALNVLGVLIAVASGTIAQNGVFIALLETFGGLINSLFITFGIVTLSFTLIERFAAEEFHAEIEQDWSPDDLEKVEETQRVKISEQAIEITLGIIFIVLINVYLDRIGIYYISDGSWVSTPILNDNILRYIPWVTAITVLDIALNLYLIRKGTWDVYATLAKVVNNVFKMVLIVAIIAGPAIISIDPASWQALNLELGISAQRISQQLNTVLDILLGLAAFGLVVDSIKHIVRAFFKKDQTPFQIDVK